MPYCGLISKQQKYFVARWREGASDDICSQWRQPKWIDKIQSGRRSEFPFQSVQVLFKRARQRPDMFRECAQISGEFLEMPRVLLNSANVDAQLSIKLLTKL